MVKVDFVRIGGLPVIRADAEQLGAIMARDVAAARKGELSLPRVVTSANGNVVALYHMSPAFRRMIDACDIVDCDGMAIALASRWLTRTPLPERVATTDWLLTAARVAQGEGLRFYFLGGRPGVALRAAEHLVSRFPDLAIAGTRHGYFDMSDLPRICEEILAAGTDVLWVGLGNPLQEEFALKAREMLPGVGWIRTCGGLFDHYGGGVSRAPLWMQNSGLEWAYRAAREPLRLGLRYLITNPIAVYHLLVHTGNE